MNNLEATDFNSVMGFMIFGNAGSSTTSCTNMCSNHGLSCNCTYTAAGLSVGCADLSVSFRYCWCS